jgi:hypothetical protein
MANIELIDQTLSVKITGIDSFLSFTSQIGIPLRHIVKASLDNAEAREFWKGIKAPGMSFGSITVGSFHKHNEWVFFDVHNPDQAITIELTDEHYKRLVIEVDNPEATVNTINEAIATYQAQQATRQ